MVRYRDIARAAPDEWHEVPMVPLTNDRWQASFLVAHMGRYEYVLVAWVDHFATWQHALAKRVAAGQDVSSELLEGAAMIRAAAERAASHRRPVLAREARRTARVHGAARRPRQVGVVERSSPRAWRSRPIEASPPKRTRRRVIVDRERARFSTWYEMFPRSAGPDPTRSATFREAAARLPAIADLGFDVLYLPPIHPIGRAHRKGRGNSLTPQPGDPGSPWAIGGAEGGHTAIEPGLGTIDDFRWFRAQAERLGLEIALDLAYQASPDHPYTREHPEWFRHRPDGTLKYAENPPKKYQDIYPFDFESDHWRELWLELRNVVLYWVEQGVRIFRVDNPHTKPFAFWEWMIADIQARTSGRDLPGRGVYAAEGDAPPRASSASRSRIPTSRGATRRRSSRSISPSSRRRSCKDYFRPNLFANTPDILHEFLQKGGPPAFRIRLVLAATLGATYGIYSGFELCENRAGGTGLRGVSRLGEIPDSATATGQRRAT